MSFRLAVGKIFLSRIIPECRLAIGILEYAVVSTGFYRFCIIVVLHWDINSSVILCNICRNFFTADIDEFGERS